MVDTFRHSNQQFIAHSPEFTQLNKAYLAKNKRGQHFSFSFKSRKARLLTVVEKLSLVNAFTFVSLITLMHEQTNFELAVEQSIFVRKEERSLLLVIVQFEESMLTACWRKVLA